MSRIRETKYRTTVTLDRDEQMELQEILDVIGMSYSEFVKRCARAYLRAVKEANAQTPTELRMLLEGLLCKY